MIYHFIKRLLDIIISLVALVFVLPITILVFVIDCFGDNKGPVFYKQRRIGKGHKPFYIYKYRSMIVEAEKRLYDNKELYDKYVANSYKLPPHEDPRITRFGRFLRKSSLDELPQFLNILKGEMTLIGPRPVVEPELQMYGDKVDKLLSVTPGAMGYWQASGRSSIGYPKRCELELYYVDHASLWFDFKIMLKNIVSIFKTDGAF
ncbi:sugar transferase [Ligilactobacillus sp. WILCCON 0076]|uniref:Sugar transferase n=1 Tax=Ligilactobacillus ubinensis TaxID=2876789 RepID=A0A9X2FNX9_9LACO|nr:sugar transferase [Ligilactobacillus ubinensis]MCP0887616.1 sugar transferase [Ligilactobacillus ubinensis]